MWPYKGNWVKLSWDWADRKQEAIEEVDQKLAGIGLSAHAVMAMALAKKIDEFERIDRMILHAEIRRDAVLREIDRHRATLGQKLRNAVEQIHDAEFEVVEQRHGEAGHE